MDKAYNTVYIIALCFFAACILVNLLRAIFSKTIADRLISINMTGTVVICAVAVLTLMLGEAWLADICLIYALVSFIAVVALTKVYIGVSVEKKKKEGEQNDGGDN